MFWLYVAGGLTVFFAALWLWERKRKGKRSHQVTTRNAVVETGKSRAIEQSLNQRNQHFGGGGGI